MGIITDIFKLLFMPVYVIYKIIVAVLFVGVLSLFFSGCAPAVESEVVEGDYKSIELKDALIFTYNRTDNDPNFDGVIVTEDSMAMKRRMEKEIQEEERKRRMKCLDVLDYVSENYNTCLVQTGRSDCVEIAKQQAYDIVKEGNTKCKASKKNLIAIRNHLDTSARVGFKSWQDEERARKYVGYGGQFRDYLILDFED